MTFASLVGLVSALAFTLGLIVLASSAARRLRPGSPPDDAPGRIDVLARAGLAPRQGVATIRVEGRVFVVSYGDGGIRHIADVEVQASEPRIEVGSTRKGATPRASSRPAAARPPREIVPAFARLLTVAGRRVATLRTPTLIVALCCLGYAPAVGQQAVGPQLDPQITGAIVGGLTGSGPAPQVDLRLGDPDEGLRVTGTVGTVLFIGFMTMIPTLLLLTTSFTRILIVLHLLKQALGTQTAPPAHLLAAMALLLTGFVMAPTFEQIHRTAIEPWMAGEMDEIQLLETASGPMRDFMLSTVREQDVAAFLAMRDAPPPATVDEVPFVVLTSAFVTSELTSAFQMGFALFLPFVIIDVVVASVLMSMGMFMLPPVMVSLPFKLLLFVLVDGWSLVMSSLVQSF